MPKRIITRVGRGIKAIGKDIASTQKKYSEVQQKKANEHFKKAISMVAPQRREAYMKFLQTPKGRKTK